MSTAREALERCYGELEHKPMESHTSQQKSTLWQSCVEKIKAILVRN